MSDNTVKNIFIVTGVIVFLGIFAAQPVAAIVLAIIVGGVFYTLKDRFKSETEAEAEMAAYRTQQLHNVMWKPIEIELAFVVSSGGAVTAATSVWSGVGNLAKQESSAKFHQGMERYVNQRSRVASLAASAPGNDGLRGGLESEQQLLLFLSRELLEQAREALRSKPVGSILSVDIPDEALRPPLPTPRRTSQASPGRVRAQTIQEEPKLAVQRKAQRISDPPELDRVPQATLEFTASSVKSPNTPPQVETPKPPVEPRQVKPVMREIEATSPSVKVEPVVSDMPIPTTPVKVPPVEPLPRYVPEPIQPVAEPEPTLIAPPVGLQLDVVSVCEDLFAPKLMSYETNRLFDERYKDQTVRWTGIARRANTYSYDSTFGENDGTKVEFDLYEIEQGYSKRMVKGFVQMPKDAIDDLRSQIGNEVTFKGRLLTCEGSSRRLYVADARLVEKS